MIKFEFRTIIGFRTLFDIFIGSVMILFYLRYNLQANIGDEAFLTVYTILFGAADSAFGLPV